MIPDPDLHGAHAIAKRIRTADGGLRVLRTDGQGVLRTTACLCVAVSKQILIADADRALTEAKRGGKNRTIRALARATDASGAGYA